MYGRRVVRFKIHKLLNIFLIAHAKNKFKRMLSFGISCRKKALGKSLASTERSFKREAGLKN